MLGRLGAVLGIALPFAGCDSGGIDSAGRASPGPVGSSAQRLGDAAQGRDVWLNAAVADSGVPHRAYLEVVGGSRPIDEAPSPARPGPNRDLPYQLTIRRAPSGVDLVTENCAVCHSASLRGVHVQGLGNAFLDMTQDPLIGILAAESGISGRSERVEWQRWRERVTDQSAYRMTDTLGVNGMDHLALAPLARRDPRTLAWRTDARSDSSVQPVLPIAVPPLWSLAKKTALFWNGQGRGDQARLLTLAAMPDLESAGSARGVDRRMANLRAYLATLEPPNFPYPIDRALAETGRSLYLDECERCHRSPGDRLAPSLLVALGTIGTDPALARRRWEEWPRLREWIAKLPLDGPTELAPGLGYVAQPLGGIWATAPYLHNDSVPTLADLLEPPSRPIYWRFARTPQDAPIYDPQRVGWQVERLSEGKSAAMSWDERDRIYDTGSIGYGNGGHDYGSRLSGGQRQALIEYLKTL